MATMQLEIITAERQVFGDDVEMVVAPGIDGELGILPHHAPLMTILQPGEVAIRIDGQGTFLAVTGGFMEVIGNKVTILADACERADEIDEARAQTAVERAKERLAHQAEDLQMERAVMAIRRAQIRLNVVRRRRVRSGISPGAADSGPSASG
ncbi:MAG: F0F1 ATP synthase subunit epsilon [Dehalococcoidia bacterium]|jgi:F-type H+-transporting ATPase subunit epsilon|nr:F0F1 ATP synthase subunit epsilon [Dehalococcoidia bacterium]MDP6228306.1 F0F1 ATP synthase subunit epsilon [Dehalococcoidia bacterium]MDP7083886.1 F0F1 ATP synthase subunit epsilon [Dehalococcoidia bacterium]MDP7200988.1 F0F1 ATP synthase subunit epsilon [Dehalococcoidia bacterium]MDP7511114.1 F0F1 ATP synthase subunit epsilon [Dehalococcoidia bacterium]